MGFPQPIPSCKCQKASNSAGLASCKRCGPKPSPMSTHLLSLRGHHFSVPLPARFATLPRQRVPNRLQIPASPVEVAQPRRLAPVDAGLGRGNIDRQIERLQHHLFGIGRDPGLQPPLPNASVRALAAGAPDIIARWTNLTELFDTAHINAISADVPEDSVGPFNQGPVAGGALSNNLGDLRRLIPLFATAGIRVGAENRRLVTQISGGADLWIERRTDMPEVQGSFPNVRAAAKVECLAFNLGDIIRWLIAFSDCIPDRLVQICNFPTLVRSGVPASQRYYYVINPVPASDGGLIPGTQLDISLLVRAQPKWDIDFLVRRPIPFGGPLPLDTDGVFAGLGLMTNSPGENFLREAAVSAVCAGDLSRTVDPTMQPFRNSTFAFNRGANHILSAGLRTVRRYQATLAEGELGWHSSQDGGQGERLVLDALDVQDVLPAVLADDPDREFSRVQMNAPRQPRGQLFRFTISIATLPQAFWEVHSDRVRYKYSFKTSVSYAHIGAQDDAPVVRSRIFRPILGYYERSRLPNLAQNDHWQPGYDIRGEEAALHWATGPGELGVVVGAFSHRTAGGPRLGFTLESVDARLYFRGVDLGPRGPEQNGWFIDPDVVER